jgi:hypothetical protein
MMKAKHRIAESTGMLGGKTYAVRVSVELNPQEQALLSKYGVYTAVNVGDRFSNLGGVDPAGNVQFDRLLGGMEIKAPSIQMASDLVSAIMDGLRGVKNQFDSTQMSVDQLGKEFEAEIE